MSTAAPLADLQVDADVGEFVYRPVPPLVVSAAVCVLLSVAAFVWDVLVLVPVLGAVLAAVGYWQVRRSADRFSGDKLALISGVLLVLLAGSASAFHAYNFLTEIPEGFRRVSFPADISAKGFVVKNGAATIPDEVAQLDSQPIFLKGYMYPTRQTEGLKSFVLCKDSGDCCFGGQPKPSDMIYIEMQEQPVNYRAGLVAVGGVFRTSPTLDETGLNPVYKLECQFFGPAKTTY